MINELILTLKTLLKYSVIELNIDRSVCKTPWLIKINLTVYANYIGPLVMTYANCEGFPICDDRITENDRCVLEIIGIHWSKYMFKVNSVLLRLGGKTCKTYNLWNDNRDTWATSLDNMRCLCFLAVKGHLKMTNQLEYIKFYVYIFTWCCWLNIFNCQWS